MDNDDLRRELREQFEQAMETAIEAVAKAPDGRWIAGSEWQVREAFLGLMGECYQRILQDRIDHAPAADAPPFSPSGPPPAPRQGPTRRRRRDRRGRGDPRT